MKILSVFVSLLLFLCVFVLLSTNKMSAQDFNDDSNGREEGAYGSTGNAASLRIDPIPANAALAIRVNAGKDECLFEEVRIAGQKVFFHFEVTGGGQLDIDATVTGPDGAIVWSAEKEHESRILFKAAQAGSYRFCLSNKMSTVTQKTVAFTIQVSDSEGRRGAGGRGGAPAGSAVLASDPIEKMTMQLADGLQELRNEQQYLKIRERMHRDTIESTNTRITLYSVGEIVLIVGVGVAQLWYLKSSFDKRRQV
jgi:hypothetical protein